VTQPLQSYFLKKNIIVTFYFKFTPAMAASDINFTRKIYILQYDFKVCSRGKHNTVRELHAALEGHRSVSRNRPLMLFGF
jgi:hypothetical protein